MPSQKILEAKKQVVSSYVSEFKEALSFVFADSRGLTVEEDTELRNELRKNNVKYQVVKNTTSRFVFQELQIEGLEEILKGPTAIAYSKEDAIASAKIVEKFAEKFENLEIKSGVMDGKVISADEVKTLAKIPAKEVLYTQIACGFNSPITKLAMLLDALRIKLESEGEIAPSEPVAEVAPVAEAAVEAEPVVEAAEPAVEAVVETEAVSEDAEKAEEAAE